ncbi:MAG: Histidine kinase [Solirubrobacterales bacterium]|nr:Histidine kinase [Solirubrobacterales bacterium]
MGDHARRVAAELHDGAMQEITLARLQLDLLAAGSRDDPRLAAQLAEVGDALGEASARLQALMRSLAPAGLQLVHPSS